MLFNLYCTLCPALRPVTHPPCSQRHDGGQSKPCGTGRWVLAVSSLPNIWDSPEGESTLEKLGRAKVRPVPRTCVLGVCWAALVMWAAGSEVGSCQMAPFQVVHGSDPAAWGHWSAPGCGDGGAGFAFYVQNVHLLLDNKTPSSISLPVIVPVLQRAASPPSESMGASMDASQAQRGQHREDQLATTVLHSRRSPTPEGCFPGEPECLWSWPMSAGKGQEPDRS